MNEQTRKKWSHTMYLCASYFMTTLFAGFMLATFVLLIKTIICPISPEIKQGLAAIYIMGFLFGTYYTWIGVHEIRAEHEKWRRNHQDI